MENKLCYAAINLAPTFAHGMLLFSRTSNTRESMKLYFAHTVASQLASNLIVLAKALTNGFAGDYRSLLLLPVVDKKTFTTTAESVLSTVKHAYNMDFEEVTVDYMWSMFMFVQESMDNQEKYRTAVVKPVETVFNLLHNPGNTSGCEGCANVNTCEREDNKAILQSLADKLNSLSPEDKEEAVSFAKDLITTLDKHGVVIDDKESMDGLKELLGMKGPKAPETSMDSKFQQLIKKLLD